MKRFIVYSIGEGCDVYLDIVPAETMPAAEAKVGDLRQSASVYGSEPLEYLLERLQQCADMTDEELAADWQEVVANVTAIEGGEA